MFVSVAGLRAAGEDAKEANNARKDLGELGTPSRGVATGIILLNIHDV